jgi:hypothetical protein
VLLSFYAGGLASVASDKYAALSAMIRQPTFELRSWRRHPCDTLFALAPFRVIKDEVAKRLPQTQGHFTPLNKHLHLVLREPLKRHSLSDQKYDDIFIRFEYLLALVAASSDYQSSGKVAIPEGSYYWEKYILSNLSENSLLVHVQTNREIEQMGEKWSPFQSGMFNLSFDKLLEFKKQFDDKMYQTAYRRF